MTNTVEFPDCITAFDIWIMGLVVSAAYAMFDVITGILMLGIITIGVVGAKLMGVTK
jgi:hypothetical protein